MMSSFILRKRRPTNRSYDPANLASVAIKALKVARHYFEMLGTGDYWTTRALGEYVMRLFEQGERRPLVLANPAIVLMERQLEIEEELRRVAPTIWHFGSG
jgi:hypothetical protein